MTVTGGNKKCLFLSYFWIVVRKKTWQLSLLKMYFSTNRKNVFYWVSFCHQLCSIQMGSFVSCIQMNADAYEHCPKREMILSPYF